MKLKEQFDSLKSWAAERGILMVEGDYEQNKSALVDIENSNNNASNTFQILIEKLEVKAIVFDTLWFDSKKFNAYEIAVNELKDDSLKTKFDSLRIFENQFLGYSTMIFHEGMTFRYSKYIDKLDDYLEVESKALDYIEGENDKEDSEYKDLPDAKIQELGKQLAENENYPRLKSRNQREALAREVFSMEFEELAVHPSYGASIIVSYSERYYETAIKPQREKELKAKIKELLGKGWTKVKIAAELNISKDILNKYV